MSTSGAWTALVVEDEAIVADMLRSILVELGCAHVECVDSVATALIALSGRQPDIALLDVNLEQRLAYPVADQLEALAVPFIFITGHGRVGVPARWLNPVVGKPFTGEDIATAIRAATGAIPLARNPMHPHIDECRHPTG